MLPAAADGALRWRVAGVSLLGLLNALLLVWGGAAGAGAGRQLAAVLAGAGAGAAALLWLALDAHFARVPRWWIVGLALVLRLIAMQASPLLEDDHFRYLWDGLRTATALDPYHLPPSAFFGAGELAPHWQRILSGINNPDVPTIYGPLLQWLFALAYEIAPGRVGAIQGLLLLADMATLALLMRQGVGRRWLLAYALHPLILKEAMASAHPDGLVALLLLLALLAWQQRRAVAVGVMLGLAVGTKVAALVVLPLLLLGPAGPVGPISDGPARRWLSTGRRVAWAARAGAGFLATLAALYLPFIVAGGSDLAALGIFGSQWRFNPLLYRVLEAALPAPAARASAALLLAVGIGAIVWRWRRGSHSAQGPALPPLDAVLVLLLLLSPVVNAWYWLWALALSVYAGRAWVAVAGVSAALAYLNTTVILEAAVWPLPAASPPFAVFWPLALVQLLVLAAAIGVDRARARRG